MGGRCGGSRTSAWRARAETRRRPGATRRAGTTWSPGTRQVGMRPPARPSSRPQIAPTLPVTSTFPTAGPARQTGRGGSRSPREHELGRDDPHRGTNLESTVVFGQPARTHQAAGRESGDGPGSSPARTFTEAGSSAHDRCSAARVSGAAGAGWGKRRVRQTVAVTSVMARGRRSEPSCVRWSATSRCSSSSTAVRSETLSAASRRRT